MLNLDRCTVRIAPDHPTLDYQLHQALAIYQRRPLRGYFHRRADAQGVLCCKPHTAAADIHGLSDTVHATCASRQAFVAYVLSDWKPAARASLGWNTNRLYL